MSEITVTETVLELQLTGDIGPPGPQGIQGPEGPPGSGENLLPAHIISELPHPVYDDGASFLLLYENAKV